MTAESDRPAGQRQQAAYCQTHGLHYDPAKMGCALCRREHDPQPEGRGISPLLIAPVVLVAGLLAWFGSSNWSGAAEAVPAVERGSAETATGFDPAEPEAPRVGIQTAKVDPATYRSEIAGVEQILYRPAPPDVEEVEAVAIAGRLLAAKIRETDHAPRSLAAQEVEFWAARVDSGLDAGYGRPSLDRARTEWESVRERVFSPAPWFKGGNEDLQRAQLGPPPEVDRQAVRRLQEVAADLGRLIAIGRREAVSLGEILGEVETPEVRAVRNRWNEWSMEWQGRVREVAACMPGQPSMSADLNVTMAYQELGSALNQLTLVVHAANDFGVPFQSERESRFTAAESALGQAKLYLSRIPPQ